MSIAVEDWDDLSVPRRRRGDRAETETESEVGSAAAKGADCTSIAVEDWDDLSVPRRRRGDRAETETESEVGSAAAEGAEPAEGARATTVRQAVATRVDDDDDFGYGEAENLRPVLSIAGGNILIWVLAHLTGVVELIGVSFAASVGLLLAAYVLREWHRDREALVCFAGALPLPVTIFTLLT
jgi:hypothetical protein